MPGNPNVPSPTDRAVVIATRPYGSAELQSTLDGYGVAAMECRPDDAWELILSEQQPGLIVLVIDPALPEELRFITRVANWTSAWILVIAPRRKVAAEALSAGADACLKEGDHRTLDAQIGAFVRRSRSAGEGFRSFAESLQVGSMTMDLRTGDARVGKRPLPLSPQEFRLLASLAMYPASFMSTSVLMASTSTSAVTPDQALNRCKTHISNLRKKLGEASADVEIIQRRGFGYALVEKTSTK